MKTIKIILICLLAASSVFAQSKQKTKRKKTTKTAVVIKKATEIPVITQPVIPDFEILKKEFVFKYFGQERLREPGRKQPSSFSKTYVIQIKTLVPDMLIDSVYYDGKVESTRYKQRLPSNETLVFSLYLAPSDDDNHLVTSGIMDRSVSFRYKKGDTTKFLEISNFALERVFMP
jgi:hypothetical protein